MVMYNFWKGSSVNRGILDMVKYTHLVIVLTTKWFGPNISGFYMYLVALVCNSVLY